MESSQEDIRWKQRFSNFIKAFNKLEEYVDYTEFNELEKQGLIKAFEYTYELGWKTLQDLLKEKGYTDIVGPRPVIEQSFKDGYISDGKGWMKMHQGRNLTSHTYDEETANEILGDIKESYFHLLKELKVRLKKESNK